ncbi:MAG: hypothetical protein AAFR87_29115 [Bacteroidota bacterium]
MAELIEHILSLPKAEKWRIFSVLAEALRKEADQAENAEIPAWQIDLALKAREEIESGKVKPMSHTQFWSAVDARLDQIEKQAGT